MFTIIIPTMWKSSFLLPFLGELIYEPLVTEIIIVNNDHKKTPRNDLLFHEKVSMVDFGRNIYVNPAWNYGVKQSRNEHICIMNDDIKFDLGLFQKIKDFYSKHNNVGSIGFSPGQTDLNQPQYTSFNIDIIEHTAGQDLLGYGCLFFVKKSLWRHIPEDLKIYCGDAFIFDRSLWLSLKNYLITNLRHTIAYASTATSLGSDGNPIATGFLEREGNIYGEIRKNNYLYLEHDLNYTEQLIPRKLIIDAILFYNECEMLESRLEYLYEHVDYFVIVEANITYSGKPKKYNFIENIDRFNKYLNKIIFSPYFVNPDSYAFELSTESVNYESDSFLFERSQRNYITETIKKIKQDSYVMISDCDEIPNIDVIHFVTSNFPSTRVVSFIQHFLCYNLTKFNESTPWIWSVISEKDTLLQYGAQFLRSNSMNHVKVYNGGWHLSYFLNPEKIIEKLESFSHQELNKDQFKNKENISNAIKDGLGLYTGQPALVTVSKEFYPSNFWNIFSKYFA